MKATTTLSKRGKATSSKVSRDHDLENPTVPFAIKKRVILGRLIDCHDMEELINSMRDDVMYYDSIQIGEKISGKRSMHAIISQNMPGKGEMIAPEFDNSLLMESSGHIEPLGDL